MENLLTSERLFLRHLTDEDSAFILQLVNSPGWLAYIGDRNIGSTAEALVYIKNQQEGYRTFPFGLSAFCLHENQLPIGICGFLKRDHLPYRDIGYALLPEYEGLGYASEIVDASIKWHTTKFPGEPLLAQVQKDNLRSIQLLERLGFKQWEYSEVPEQTMLFRKESD